MSSTNPSPSELLRRYRTNKYPPSLSETEYESVKIYLEKRGLEPKIGAIAVESNLTTQNLASIAMSELDTLPRGSSKDDVVIGPHSLGMPNAISLWIPTPFNDGEEI